MAEATLPPVEEARRWVGSEVRDLGTASIGTVEAIFADAESGEPAWLIARVGRWRNTRTVAVPLRNCAGAAFGVWIAEDADKLKRAPAVDPTRPLRREHELTICTYYGIGEEIGRASEVAGRKADSVTAVPLRD